MLFKTRMIRVKGDKTSEAYANYCKQSWFGFDLRYYDAVTPETLHEQSGLTFGMKGSIPHLPYRMLNYQLNRQKFQQDMNNR